MVVTPVTSSMTATVTSDLARRQRDRHGDLARRRARPAVLPGVQSSKGGNYQILVTGGPGEYKVTATLNAYVDPAAYGGTPERLDRHGHADRSLRQQVHRPRRPHGRPGRA